MMRNCLLLMRGVGYVGVLLEVLFLLKLKEQYCQFVQSLETRVNTVSLQIQGCCKAECWCGGISRRTAQLLAPRCGCCSPRDGEDHGMC
eukprot:5992447-Amphidinium_carterae.1